MKRARLASFVLTAAIVMSLVAISAAAAAGPLFLGAKPNHFTGTSGVSIWSISSAGINIECKTDTSTGEISSTTLAGNIFVHFLECTGIKGTATCPVMTPGAPLENLILTHTLHGVLGLVLPVPATGSDVGLLLLPGTGNKLFTLLGECVLEAVVSGSIAGLVTPVGPPLVLAATVTFGVTGGAQNIKDIDLTNGPLVAPELTYFTDALVVGATESLTFAKDVEVM